LRDEAEPRLFAGPALGAFEPHPSLHKEAWKPSRFRRSHYFAQWSQREARLSRHSQDSAFSLQVCLGLGEFLCLNSLKKERENDSTSLIEHSVI